MKAVAIMIIPLVLILGCRKTCDAYHEGERCEKEIREKYYGTYTGKAYNGKVYVDNSLNVTTHPNGANFLTIGSHMAKLNTYHIFTIPLQDQHTSSIVYKVRGNGYFKDNRVSMTFMLSHQGDTATIHFEGQKD